MNTESLVIDGVTKLFEVIPTKGDGSCFFQSLSYFLYRRMFAHQTLRETVVLYVFIHWERFKNYAFNKEGNAYFSKNVYKTEMSQQGTFATACEVQAASEVYSLAFEVYFDGSLIFSFGKSHWPVHRLHFTGELDEGHFQPLKEISDNIEDAPTETVSQILNRLHFGGTPQDRRNEDAISQAFSQLNLANPGSTSPKKKDAEQKKRGTVEKQLIHEKPTPQKTIAKKQRGRPKKVIVLEKLTPQKNLAKKPRGRPRKNNHSPAIAAYPISDDADLEGISKCDDGKQNTVPEQVVKTSRGRPKKVIVHEKPTPQKNVAKKPRGRPQKNNLSPAIAAHPIDEGADLEGISKGHDDVQNTVAEQVVKKPRGRPKKVTANEKEKSKSQKNLGSKKRGRPRKIIESPQREPVAEDSEFSDIIPLSDSNESASSIEKSTPQELQGTKQKRKSKKKLSALQAEKRILDSHKKSSKNNPEAHRKAVATYSQAHPEVHRHAAAAYAQAHPEVHRDAVRRSDPNNENRQRRQNKLWLEKEGSGFSYDPDIDYKSDGALDIGGMTVVCKYCKALKWKKEWPTLCCGNGKIQIPLIEEPPSPLYELLTHSHQMSHHFLNNIRKYNCAFQMTSFGAKEIHEGGFMPTFKVQGQVYHRAGSLLPDPNEEAKFLQIFFLGDEDKEADVRHKNFSDLKPDLIRELQRMLHLYNVYVQDFKAAIESVPTNTKDFQVLIRAERKPLQGHPGQFNAPQVNEVAVLMVGDTFEKRDIVLKSRANTLQRISEIHRSYDTLQYPLIFCRGEDGYSINISQRDPTTKQPLKKTVSAIDFYSHHLMVRENSYNHLSYFGSLLNQFVVDMYAKVETERLNFIRHNQKKLRAENYIHLQDAIKKADANMPMGDLGQMVVLPSSFVGSPRYMHQRTQDAMTYVRKYGRPDLFITFTCNPNWTQILRELLDRQNPKDRYDIVNRVFHLQVKNAMDMMEKGRVFGERRCYMYSVEWQKRGLPHVHILLWLKKKITPDQVDQVVCAEIPDPEKDPELHELVKTHMIHGPCGNSSRPSVCMSDGRCSKRYPRPFLQETQTGDDGYPLYRRRSPDQGGFTAKIMRNGEEITVDNRWVVPYNPVLLRCFQGHINVEICNSVKSIKYVCKYVNKGSDMATFGVTNENDEIEVYVTGRYISSSEAIWRMFSFPIHERYPSVLALAIHLENGQRVYFTANDLMQKLSTPPTTTLLQFFQLCQNDDFAQTICYQDVPSFYVWRNNAWHRRKQGEIVDGYVGVKKDDCLGRVYTVHPNNAECFYLRILLHVVPGPTSFQFLKVVNGVAHPTFQSACKALGLLEDDDHWDKTLEEAALVDSPAKIRELFAVMLVFCHVSDPASLWDKYKEWFAEDILRQERIAASDMTLEPTDDTYNQALILLENLILSVGGKNLKDYGLPEPRRSLPVPTNTAYDTELNYDVAKLADFVQRNEAGLTNDQRKVYLEILSSIQNDLGKIFFLDAPGGTGKTFLINLLLAKVRSGKKIAIASASSGIAATLLQGGKTAHSAFKLPLNLSHDDSPVCNISKQSSLARVLKDCSLIVWDECTMSHKRAVEALSRTLKDIRNNPNSPMGGVTVLFAGDFRQTLPVIPRGTRADEVNASLKFSSIWRYVQRLSLSTNMRVHLRGDNAAGEFADLLLKIGNGLMAETNGKITIPDKMAVVVKSTDELISKIYPNVALNLKNVSWLCERAILAPKNDMVETLNDKIIHSLLTQEREYKSIDSVLHVDDAVNYPVEFLNSLTPPGIPPHKLKLKIGAPIMLLRNLNPPKLCNGTRLQIKSLQNNLIQATIFTGCGSGETVLIPRIPMIPSDFPFEFKRLQFPIRVCFAMTINKSQGQSLTFAGVDLSQNCFSHGHLYVASSRVSKSSNLFIHAPGGETVNVVYQEALTDIARK